LLAALALVDVWPHIRWEHALVAPAEVDLWIARERAGPLFLHPVDRPEVAYPTVYRATVHHQPMFNGLSSFEPPLNRMLRERPVDDATRALLERNGCRYVAVRPEWCGYQAPLIFDWLRRGLAQGRLAFVRRFEFNAGGDWL